MAVITDENEEKIKRYDFKPAKLQKLIKDFKAHSQRKKNCNVCCENKSTKRHKRMLKRRKIRDVDADADADIQDVSSVSSDEEMNNPIDAMMIDQIDKMRE